MAQRGRPKKKKKVDEPIPEVEEKEVEVAEQEPDISDVDYQEKPKESISEPVGSDYNPFAQSVEEKAYRTPKVETSPLIGDIGEPVFERPTLSELMKENEEQVTEDGLGGQDAFSQQELNELPDKQKEEAAKGLVEQALNIYTLGCKGMGYLAKIKESKVDKLARDGSIDMNLRVPVDAYTSVSIPQIVQGFNAEIQDTFEVTEEFKESVRPAMTRVFIKRGWGVTDEQQLLLAFGMDLAQKGAILVKLKKEGDMQIKRFVEMTNISRGKDVEFVTESEGSAPQPATQTEPQTEEEDISTTEPSGSEKSMVQSVNPDLKVSEHDLKQVDVDNV